MGRDHGERWERSASVGDHHGAGSHQFGSYWHQDRSREYADRESTSLEERQPWNAAMDNMSSALCRPTQSPFSRDIERAPMPSRFTKPPFNSYHGKTNPVEHVSHYIQMMSLHTHNDALMRKVFPLSFSPTAFRWFNGLRKCSIHSFSELMTYNQSGRYRTVLADTCDMYRTDTCTETETSMFYTGLNTNRVPTNFGRIDR